MMLIVKPSGLAKLLGDISPGHIEVSYRQPGEYAAWITKLQERYLRTLVEIETLQARYTS
jgi:hypothetical protein